MGGQSLRRTVAVAVAAGALFWFGSFLAGRWPALAAEGEIVIDGGGWGHGVGMSQYGAKGRAEAGQRYDEILHHYYAGVTVPVVESDQWDDVRVLLAAVDEPVVLVPTNPTELILPDGASRQVTANETVAIGLAEDGQQVVVIGGKEAGRFPAIARTRLVLDGVHAAAGREGGDAIGEYRWGQLEVSAGVADCEARQCVTVRGLTMDHYLWGVDEMPSLWPTEALKAQAVAARSFADRKLGADPDRLYDVLASPTDQLYAGWKKEGEKEVGDRWVQAVTTTSGRVVQIDGKTVGTVYSSSNGGHSEASEYVWSTPEPHLQAAPDPYDEVSPRHRWTRTYQLEEIGSWFGVEDVRELRITGPVGASGRIDKATIEIVGATTERVTGNVFRATINTKVPGDRALWSTKWAIR